MSDITNGVGVWGTFTMTPEQQAAYDETQRRYDLGRNAGLAGEPMPEGAHEQAYRRGGVERRGRSGEAIVIISTGSRCQKCGESNWGWRLGCRCWTDEENIAAFHGNPNAFGMDYGAFVYPVSQDRAQPAPFMTRDELLAARDAGKPVIDDEKGEPVDFGDAGSVSQGAG